MLQKMLVITYVPYRQADEPTQAAFVDAGKTMGVFVGEPPDEWTCTACGKDHALDDLGLAYGTIIGIPVCPSSECVGHGWAAINPKRSTT